MGFRPTLLSVCCLLMVGGCGEPAAPPEKMSIAVSILPLTGLVQTLVGDEMTVTTAVAPGQSPATFDPSPRQMGALARARIFFACGVPMENHLLPRLRSNGMEIVDTTAGIERLPLTEHTHDDGHPHGHESELDPHLWLDPHILAHQVRIMGTALARLDPARTDLYAFRTDSLCAELDALGPELVDILASVRGKEMIVFHPAFGYLARATGLRQVAIQQGGVDPSPRHLATILDGIRARGARAVFVQPQFSVGSAQAVARDAGVELVVLDPLAPGVIENLRVMAHSIKEALDER